MPRKGEARGKLEEIDLTDLTELPEVGRVTADKLRSVGIRSIRHLALLTSDELVELVGMDPLRAQRILSYARQMGRVSALVMSAKERKKWRESLPRLTTGCKSIDDLLKGGLEPISIYEFAGEFGVGKTQLCHQLSVTAQLSRDRGGIASKVVYIDTEHTFSTERIESIAERFDLDPELATENITVVEPMNVDDLISFVVTELPRLVEDGYKLIIVDSIIARFRSEYVGIEWLARRQQRMNYMLGFLLRIGKSYGTYTVITNQVVQVIGRGVNVKAPTGGTIIAHASTHRFFLKKRGNAWAIEALDSPTLPRGASALYRITERGIEDV